MPTITEKLAGFFNVFNGEQGSSNTVEINDHGEGASKAKSFVVKLATGLALAAVVIAGAPNADAQSFEEYKQQQASEFQNYKQGRQGSPFDRLDSAVSELKEQQRLEQQRAQAELQEKLNDPTSFEYNKHHNTPKYQAFVKQMAEAEAREQAANAPQAQSQETPFSVSASIGLNPDTGMKEVTSLTFTGALPPEACEGIAGLDSQEAMNGYLNDKMKSMGQPIHSPLRTSAGDDLLILQAVCDRIGGAGAEIGVAQAESSYSGSSLNM